MANGNGAGSNGISPVKILISCISISIAINSVALYLQSELNEELRELRIDLNKEIDRKTYDRYTGNDATRDFKLRDFRIEQCERRLEQLSKEGKHD